MSVYTKCVTCDGGAVTLDQLLKSLFVKDADGTIGLEVKLNVCDADTTPAVDCGTNVTLEQLVKGALVVDECGHCALKLFVDFAGVLKYIKDNTE